LFSLRGLRGGQNCRCRIDSVARDGETNISLPELSQIILGLHSGKQGFQQLPPSPTGSVWDERVDRRDVRMFTPIRRIQAEAPSRPRGFPPGHSALSGSDRHSSAVSQCLDIAHWWLAKETPVLAIELARAFVADLERRTCRIQFTREHPLPCCMKAKPLLKLKRTHRGKGTKMVVQRGSAHACYRCQIAAHWEY
jgi:hypothetical protein